MIIHNDDRKVEVEVLCKVPKVEADRCFGPHLQAPSYAEVKEGLERLGQRIKEH